MAWILAHAHNAQQDLNLTLHVNMLIHLRVVQLLDVVVRLQSHIGTMTISRVLFHALRVHTITQLQMSAKNVLLQRHIGMLLVMFVWLHVRQEQH